MLCAGRKLYIFVSGCLKISGKGRAGYLTPISHFIHQNLITNAVRFLNEYEAW